MIDERELLRLVQGITADDLHVWIRNRWVRAEREGGAYLFSAMEVARVRLIHEMRHDLGVEEETLPLVLSLVDQLYATRAELHRLMDALARQPRDVRDLVLGPLRGPLGGGRPEGEE
ncbi:MAG: hypothetical protein H6907_15850 [Hyphomicrobiales bacterium]|nr:hypothetical protein [Hyphomicrobiales bacterium]